MHVKDVVHDTEGINATAPKNICAKALKQYHLYLTEGPQEEELGEAHHMIEGQSNLHGMA